MEAQVDLLCPKVGITGQSIPEHLPATRAAMAPGAISPEHATKIAQAVGQVLPEHADQVDVEMAEAQNTLDLKEHEDGSLSGRFELGAESAAVLRPLLSSLGCTATGRRSHVGRAPG